MSKLTIDDSHSLYTLSSYKIQQRDTEDLVRPRANKEKDLVLGTNWERHLAWSRAYRALKASPQTRTNKA